MDKSNMSKVDLRDTEKTNNLKKEIIERATKETAEYPIRKERRRFARIRRAIKDMLK